MSKYSIEGSTLTDIADAIRAKTGDPAALTAAAMAEAIGSISGGGGLEYESGEWIGNGKAIAQINFSNSHSEPPIFAMLWRPDDLSLRYANIYTIVCRYPSRIHQTSETILDGHVEGKRRGSTGSMSDTGTTLYKTDGGRQSLSYWLTNERFTPDGRGSSETWVSGVTHKWIAIWAPEE